jgi:hypothetical protein
MTADGTAVGKKARDVAPEFPGGLGRERLRIRANEWDVRSSNISKKDFTVWDAQKLRGATGMNVPGRYLAGAVMKRRVP